MIAGIDQHELVEPELLADQDSCFSDFNGVRIHHKVCDSDADLDHKTRAEFDREIISASSSVIKKRCRNHPMVLLHGFGASLFSWSRVMKPLSELSGSKVLAFDRPAFGFTSRSMNPNSGPLNPYSMAYSVLSTLFFVNYLGAEKTILVGHSFGSIVAVNTYFKSPERFAALILVDPAIVAPFTSGRKSRLQKENHKYRFNVSTRIYNFIESAIIRIVKLIAIVLAAILRSTFGVMLARFTIDKLGIAIVKFAWHDRSRVSEDTVGGYTKPLRCKGWDRGAVEFMAAMLVDFTDHESRPVPTKPLTEISCPVLIITGDDDRIVPFWNSKRLSKAISGSVFEVIKQCGHIPPEENPEEFVSAVQRFLQRADFSM